MDLRWIVGIAPLAGICCGGRDSTDDEGARAELIIPMVPATTASRWLPPPEGPIVGGGGELGYTVQDSLDVAMGDGYPPALDLTLRGYPISGAALCGQFVEPTMTIDAIEQVPGLQVEALDVNQLRITHTAEGRHPVALHGRYRFEAPPDCAGAPSEAAFTLALEVVVRRPTGVVFHLPAVCAAAGETRLQSGAELAMGLTMELVDSSGEAFVPLNADGDRPVDLRVTAAATTDLSTGDASLATLVAAGPPTTVRVEALGEALAFDLLEPGDVDAMDAVFTLTGSTLTDLAPGATYGEDGWDAGTYGSIQPALFALYSAGDPLCSRPLAESFELASASADVCPIVADRAHGIKLVGGFLVPQSADILADGRCELSLHAPAFADGAGVSAHVSATFVNTEELTGFARD
jgi:hypothetical protein